MNEDARFLLRHFLAAIAYRTQKALRGAPDDFGDFRAATGARTPHELVRHMTGVLGYARTYFTGGEWRPRLLLTFEAEVQRLHETLEDLAAQLKAGGVPRETTAHQLLQGPLADVMTHVGQLALLRRLAGSPVPPENFIAADIDASRLGREQSLPISPDEEWLEAEDERER